MSNQQPLSRPSANGIAMRTTVHTICNTSVWADDDFTVLTSSKDEGGRRTEGLFSAGGAIGNAITNAGLGAL